MVVCSLYPDTISRNAEIIVGACDALPGFQPTVVGGDGDAVQNCEPITLEFILTEFIVSNQVFVGYWPDQDTVVVAHQGTDPTKL